MTMTRDKIEEAVHDLVKLWDSQHVGEDDFNEEMCRIEAIFREFALAERALEPQGQALPELPSEETVAAMKEAWRKGTSALLMKTTDAYRIWAAIRASQLALSTSGEGLEDERDRIISEFLHCYETGDPVRGGLVEQARAYTSQLALPAGPVPATTDEMIELVKKRQSEVSAAAKRMEAGEPNGLGLMDLYRLGVMFSYMRVALKSRAVAQPVADEREAFELDYAKAWHEASVVARNHSIEHLCNELKEMRVGATYGEGNDYLNFKWEGWQARAALCQPAEEGGKA